MSDEITVKVINEGRIVEICFDGCTYTFTPQEAYELAQALSAVLPECVQPFKTK
jgi:hypothetical protein